MGIEEEFIRDQDARIAKIQIEAGRRAAVITNLNHENDRLRRENTTLREAATKLVDAMAHDPACVHIASLGDCNCGAWGRMVVARGELASLLTRGPESSEPEGSPPSPQIEAQRRTQHAR